MVKVPHPKLKSKFLIISFLILTILVVVSFLSNYSPENFLTDDPNLNPEGSLEDVHPLSIEGLRNGEYPGSDFVIEETLDPGSNYGRYIASYKSEGLKINGLLTIPNGDSPEGGWPAIVFNHGYIAPEVYRTTQRYIAYTDGFSRNGYVLFRPDYRGHANSEGEAPGAYASNAYTIDVLNAVSSVKKLKGVNPDRIGMWGHSMGGYLTLRSMVSSRDIKVGVIWAGVVDTPADLLERWKRREITFPSPISSRGMWRQELIEKYGEPSENPDFWNSISSNNYLKDLSGPVQLHHGTADASVPISMSENLEKQIKEVRGTVELFTYPGDDHNISKSFSTAMRRSIEFFDKHLKSAS